MTAATENSNKKRSINKVDKSNNEDKKISSANKKRALMHERQSHRRHYEEVRKAKEIWNKLREKNIEKSEMNAMVNELMILFKDKMKEVVLKHDASRIVQALIQFGSSEQRQSILNELSEAIPEMSKIQYAHFVVLKLIKYCARDDANRRLIVKSMKGSIPKLAVHAVGARVVELLFATLPSKSTNLLKQEMYGPKFAIFQSGEHSTATLSLKEIIEKYPESSSSALTYLHGVCTRGIEKSLFAFAYFQELLWDFMSNATPYQLKDIIPSLVDHSIHMLATRAGSKVVAYCAAYGTPKDRRKIMKSLKGYTKSSLLHKDAYIALLRLLDVTDDTVAIQKNILAELTLSSKKEGEEETDALSSLLEVALSDTGCKFFFYLLTDPTKQKHLFDPFELELLKPAKTIDKESGDVVSTSKKNPETRRRELTQYMKQSIIDMCMTHTKELMRSRNGSKIIHAVFQSFVGERENLANQIVDSCVNQEKEEDDDDEKDDKKDKKEETFSMFEDPSAHLLIKRLILSEVENKDNTDDADNSNDNESSSDAIFSSTLANKYTDRIMEIASTNRGAFVLSALVKVEKDDVSTTVKKELKKAKNLKELKRKKTEKGYAALLKEL